MVSHRSLRLLSPPMRAGSHQSGPMLTGPSPSGEVSPVSGTTASSLRSHRAAIARVRRGSAWCAPVGGETDIRQGLGMRAGGGCRSQAHT